MSRPTLTRTLFKLTAAVALFVWAGAIATSGARAYDEPSLKIKRTIKVDKVGNAQIRLQLTAPTNLYTTIKTKTPNIAVLLRKLGAGRLWALLEQIDGSFNDPQSTIDIHDAQRGLARVERGNEWSIPFDPGTPPELVDIHDTTAIYDEAATSPLGLATMIIRIECLAGRRTSRTIRSRGPSPTSSRPSLTTTGLSTPPSASTTKNRS
jgi:hypothetical protein